MHVVLSRVKTLNGLLLTNKLNDDLDKFRISDNLLKEDKRLDGLDKTFREDIKWEQINIFQYKKIDSADKLFRRW